MLVAPLVYPAYAYMPPRHLPLSPLSSNAIQLNTQQNICYGMTSSDSDSTSSKLVKQQAHQPRRPIKPTPSSSRTRDQQRSRQRDLFLRRVEQTRDDKRWEGRSEEILRCDHFTQQRRLREAYERQALKTDDITEETGLASSTSREEQEQQPMLSSYELSRPTSHFQIHSDPIEHEVDLMAQQERGELEDWALFLAESENTLPESQEQHNEAQTTDYDDDEYDAVFMELIDQQPTQDSCQPTDVEMHMS